MEKSPEKLKILERIENLEKQGIFDQDVEDDPETIELLPDQIDYLDKKLKNKILTRLTLRAGKKFFEGQIKCGNLVIKDIIGTENLLNLKKSGAIVTCNHFHPFDNYIILKALMPCLKKGRYYKVIREGNYTNPPKGFEMFMRHGDTLPLSQNRQTMRKFLEAVKVLLGKGNKVLVYPEQSMWWNYRKPKPLKNGAFNFAVTNNVPVIPLFITMEDTDKIDGDGFPIQAHTVHILPPIYPKEDASKAENINFLKEENYKAWVKVYEDFYKTPLKYLCDEEKENTQPLQTENTHNDNSALPNAV
ncbi:MAG: 1-acyl-sn-glycerol-3-phosphate acyltransferase [Clostridia bacterium]|nr:1-acyl-sn-glycerol-3-phosphate acyltransferase [Clostridia bacterium]